MALGFRDSCFRFRVSGLLLVKGIYLMTMRLRVGISNTT